MIHGEYWMVSLNHREARTIRRNLQIVKGEFMLKYDGCGVWICDKCGYHSWWVNIDDLLCPICNPPGTTSDSTLTKLSERSFA